MSTTNATLVAVPALAAPVNVITSSTAGTFGNWAEVIAANGIATDFVIAGIEIDRVGGSDDHRTVQLGVGPGGSESIIATFAAPRQSSLEGATFMLPIWINVAANARVAARVARDIGGAQTHAVRLITAVRPL